MTFRNMSKQIRVQTITKLCKFHNTRISIQSHVYFCFSVRELVLAKFDDGYFYRGVCVKVSEIDMKVHFLDFGNEYVLGIQDVMRMPRQMMRTCCSQTVAIKLASSRPISDIDANETRELLMRKDKFTAKVDMIPGTTKRIITLDDSLVVFKK